MRFYSFYVWIYKPRWLLSEKFGFNIYQQVLLIKIGLNLLDDDKYRL